MVAGVGNEWFRKIRQAIPTRDSILRVITNIIVIRRTITSFMLRRFEAGTIEFKSSKLKSCYGWSPVRAS
jgi:hypothetical protein